MIGALVARQVDRRRQERTPDGFRVGRLRSVDLELRTRGHRGRLRGRPKRSKSSGQTKAVISLTRSPVSVRTSSDAGENAAAPGTSSTADQARAAVSRGGRYLS